MPTKKTDKLTAVQYRRAVQWFQRVMRLQDWLIHLTVSASVPLWAANCEANATGVLGRCWSRPHLKTADIWLCLDHILDADMGLDTIMHELLHVQFADIGLADRMTDLDGEFVIDSLANQLAVAYLSC